MRYIKERMKLLRCLSLCLVAQISLPSSGWAAEADSAYQAAVNAYMEAAGGELRAIRLQADEVSKVAPKGKEAAFKDFYAKLEKCEKTYEALKKATAKEFDTTKAQYEQQRAEVTKAWTKATGP